jgi:hypothetical protein
MAEYAVETVVECLVTDKMKVDALTFEAWVKGLTAAEAMRYKEHEIQRFLRQMQESARGAGGGRLEQQQSDRRWRNARQLVFQECVDQYQFFEWLAPFLNEPLSFRTQTLVVVAPADVHPAPAPAPPPPARRPRARRGAQPARTAADPPDARALLLPRRRGPPPLHSPYRPPYRSPCCGLTPRCAQVCRDLIGKTFTKAVRREVDEAAEVSRNITVRPPPPIPPPPPPLPRLSHSPTIFPLR